MKGQVLSTRRPKERVLVCGVTLPGEEDVHDGDLGELRSLLEAAGAEPIGSGPLQKKRSADPATLIGSGKVREILGEIEALRPDAVAVDNDLSPAQIRNLEKAWSVRVLDRTEVILDIFASRAHTAQAKLQVELAQAQYLLPRLKRMWTHLERTEGAIGTRGPGETQLETDRRLLRKRIQDLSARLKEIQARRTREVHSRGEQFTVGLVGYTNAGKSTLLNRLTGSREIALDMLFATLDTRTRKWRLPDGRTVLLSDTVGFLRRLPHHLVASFHATLEEALHADLLLHVVDASHAKAREQMAAVESVLAELSWRGGDEIVVLNKLDRVPAGPALDLVGGQRKRAVVAVSAATGEGVDRLAELVARHLDRLSNLVEIRVPLSDGRSLAQVQSVGALLDEQVVDAREMRFLLRLSQGALGNLQRSVGTAVRFTILEAPRSLANDADGANGQP